MMFVPGFITICLIYSEVTRGDRHCNGHADRMDAINIRSSQTSTEYSAFSEALVSFAHFDKKLCNVERARECWK